MEIKESRVWQYRDSRGHRKPEGARWVWLLVGNERWPSPAFMQQGTVGPGEPHLPPLCQPKSPALFKDSHGSGQTDVKLLSSLQQRRSLLMPGSPPSRASVSLSTRRACAEQISQSLRRQGSGLGPGSSILRSEKKAVEPEVQQLF